MIELQQFYIRIVAICSIYVLLLFIFIIHVGQEPQGARSQVQSHPQFHLPGLTHHHSPQRKPLGESVFIAEVAYHRRRREFLRHCVGVAPRMSGCS